jgi:hypothetical protein
VLDRVHAHGAFPDGGGALNRFQVCNGGVNGRFVLEIFALELDAGIDRSRLQFERDLFAGVQRRAADTGAPGKSLLRLGHKGLN